MRSDRRPSKLLQIFFVALDHELHVDYLCQRWHCATEDRKIIYNQIKQKAPDDNVRPAHPCTCESTLNVTNRIILSSAFSATEYLRGGSIKDHNMGVVRRRYVLGKVSISARKSTKFTNKPCASFSRTFPWEIAENYDVLAVAGQPAFGDQRLLFTRCVILLLSRLFA